MKARAIHGFIDKISMEDIPKGAEIEVTDERFEEINSTHLGAFVEEIIEPEVRVEPKAEAEPEVEVEEITEPKAEAEVTVESEAEPEVKVEERPKKANRKRTEE